MVVLVLVVVGFIVMERAVFVFGLPMPSRSRRGHHAFAVRGTVVQFDEAGSWRYHRRVGLFVHSDESAAETRWFLVIEAFERMELCVGEARHVEVALELDRGEELGALVHVEGGDEVEEE